MLAPPPNFSTSHHMHEHDPSYYREEESPINLYISDKKRGMLL